MHTDQCDSDHSCIYGKCGPTVLNGGACMGSAQCVSGTTCIRGKCGVLSNDAIIGIVIGSAAFIALVIGGILFARRKSGT